jgi:bifunctional DNase/RNase
MIYSNFAERFDITVKQVIIHKLVDGVFYSSIICERDKIEEIIDARTSDAIAHYDLMLLSILTKTF